MMTNIKRRLGLHLQLAQHKQRQGPRGAYQEPGGAQALCLLRPVMQNQLLQRTKNCLEQGASADLQNPCSGGDGQNREEVYGQPLTARKSQEALGPHRPWEFQAAAANN